MENKKRLVINILATVFAFVVNMGISFFLTPYVVEHIGVESNGFVSLANSFVSYAQLLTVALNSMAGRFITIKMHQNDKEGASKYFSSVIIANVILSIVLTVIFSVIIVFIDRILNISESLVGDVKLLWLFILSNFILGIFTTIFSTSTFIKDRLDLSSIATIISYIIRAGILVIAYMFLKSNVVWYVGLATFCAGLYLLIANAIYKKKLTPDLKFNKNNFDIKAIKELISSGIWNTITKLSSILANGLDLLITNLFVNPIAMGVLAISKILPTNILTLFGNVGYVFAPQLTEHYAKNNYEEMKRQLINSIKFLALFSSVIMAILFAFGQEFYELWQPTQNAKDLYILTIISCLQLVFCLPFEPLYNVFTATNKIKTSSIALIITSLATVTTVFISLRFAQTEMAKLMIIAGTSTIMEIFRVLFFLPIFGAMCIKSKKTTFYPIILKNTFSVLALTLLGVSIKQIFMPDTWLKLIFVVIIVGVIGIAINTVFLLNKEDRNKIIEKIRKKCDKGEDVNEYNT